MDEIDSKEYEIGKPERLFQLTTLLLASTQGFTKGEILRLIPAYAKEYKEGDKNESLNRKFERDKATLDHTGIKIDTFIPPHEGENNQATVYVIRPDTFHWPKDLKLTSRQQALLKLAAEAWAGGSLSGPANKAVTKLKALGVVGGDSDIIGIAPRISNHEASFKDLNNAISDKQVVQFEYRNPKTNEILKRTVHPWMLKRISGQWLVVGHCELRGTTRNFMLRRIVSNVTKKSSAEYISPTQEVLDQASRELEELSQTQIAVLKIKPNTEAWFHFEMDLAANTIAGKVEIHYHDIYVLAEEIREYADQIQVVKPDALVQLVRAGFERVADQHG